MPAQPQTAADRRADLPIRPAAALRALIHYSSTSPGACGDCRCGLQAARGARDCHTTKHDGARAPGERGAGAPIPNIRGHWIAMLHALAAAAGQPSQWVQPGCQQLRRRRCPPQVALPELDDFCGSQQWQSSSRCDACKALGAAGAQGGPAAVPARAGLSVLLSGGDSPPPASTLPCWACHLTWDATPSPPHRHATLPPASPPPAASLTWS